mgnify:CR=1 FL=1|jgi:hypothetical protein
MSWPADKPKDAGLTHLASGESLLADQYICSPNDAARLMLEGNGNLTIFKLKGKPWQLNRRAKNVGVTLANQADSNLVLYDADGKPAGWASNTKGGEGSYLTVSDDGRALYTSSEGILLWSSNGKDVGGKGAPAPGSAEAEAEAAAPPAGESDAHDPPMVQGGDAAPASVEKEGSGVVQMASIAASGGVGDHPVEFIAEVKVNDLGFDFFSLLSFVSLSLSRAHASSKRLARKKKKKKNVTNFRRFPKKQDTWERDGRTMYKIEVYITNKGQHNITSLDVVVPKREVVYESWGAAHDQGEDSGRRIFSLADFIKEKGGLFAGECYNFGGVFSEANPGFLIENFDAPC